MDDKVSIKKIRAMTGLTQTEFAIKYGIPRRTLQNWETDNKNTHRECPEYIRYGLERLVKSEFNTKQNNSESYI